jgi:hypothetical protein
MIAFGRSTQPGPPLDAALPLFVAGPNAGLQSVCGAIYAFLNFKGRWDELRSLNQEAEAKALVVGTNIMPAGERIMPVWATIVAASPIC